MSMSKETFAECLAPALEYYNHELTEQTWQFYYEELGGMPVRELQENVRRHMATLKSFPMVSHLAPQKQTQERKRGIDGRNHPEFGRTYTACVRRLEDWVAGKSMPSDATYPVDIGPIVSHAIAYFKRYRHEGEYHVLSQARAGMHGHLAKAFDKLPQE